MEKKLIDLYEDWSKRRQLPYAGLCSCLEGEYAKTLSLFFPSMEERINISEKGLSTLYWGSGLKAENNAKRRSFTELRKNIVLFICAMHGEL